MPSIFKYYLLLFVLVGGIFRDLGARQDFAGIAVEAFRAAYNRGVLVQEFFGGGTAATVKDKGKQQIPSPFDKLRVRNDKQERTTANWQGKNAKGAKVYAKDAEGRL